MRADEELFGDYARRGDVDALSELVARHERRLMAFLTGMLGGEEAEDAFQDTWVKIMKRASSYRGGVFLSYLITVARRVAVDRLRAHRPLMRLDAESADGDSAVEMVSDGRLDPGARLELKATGEDVRRAVRGLAEGPRQVVLMRIEGELSFKDIARELGSPMGTVLTWMHTATGWLRRKLGGET